MIEDVTFLHHGSYLNGEFIKRLELHVVVSRGGVLDIVDMLITLLLSSYLSWRLHIVLFCQHSYDSYGSRISLAGRCLGLTSSSNSGSFTSLGFVP
jgi:hypothetical protein